MTSAAEIQARLESASAVVRERDLLRGQIDSLKQEHEAAQQVLAERRAELSDETKDVDKLENFSLTRIVAGLRGSRATDLEREQAEARAAELRVAEAQSRCDALHREWETLAARGRDLGDVDAQFRDAQAAKEQWLATQGGPEARRLTGLAEERGRLQAEHRELAEADQAAVAATQALQELGSILDDAAGWSTYDTFFGGGMMSSLVKQDKLGEAAAAARHANQLLARLSRELADVGGGSVSALAVDDLTRFLDVWFDNIFTDLSVAGRIDEAKARTAHSLEAVAGQRQQIADRGADVARRLAYVDQLRTDLLAGPAGGPLLR
ncbi:hypothetical protein [Microlunatus parietis]|uniref:Uncharacterized protein n=1 Tax=Microlunatus parietis TaxID=682979 RepID=A0A7Y9LE28_9ACTN|nr:hypothetical protein [Microlunatus parietis]NYE73393.1 hypothetical protein [Microlunatus parietis]